MTDYYVCTTHKQCSFRTPECNLRLVKFKDDKPEFRLHLVKAVVDEADEAEELEKREPT